VLPIQSVEYTWSSLSHSYFNHNPEGFNSFMALFGDAATPVSYRYTDIFGMNTSKFTKEISHMKGGKVVYANILMTGRIFPLCKDTSED
jgi:catalase